MRTDLNNLIKISIIVGIILTSLSISYYFIVFLPSQEKIKIEKAERKESERKFEEDKRQLDLDKCLLSAEEDHENLWNYNCKIRGLKNGCMLPLPLAETITKIRKEDKEDCFKKYPKTE